MMTRMTMITLSVLFLVGTVVSAFPAVNYTGQACSPAVIQGSQRCVTNKTSLFFSSNMQDASNGTHILVFAGEPFKLTCCTPPKTNSTGDVNATLAQREISYILQSGSPLSVIKGNQLNANLTSNSTTGNNSICEYSTVSLPKATHSEEGMWMCAAYGGDTPKADLHVIVGNTGRVFCDYVNIDKYPWVSIHCTLSGYSPAGAKLDWRIGTNRTNLFLLTSNGTYDNGSISVTGLKLPVEQLASSCVSFNNTYEAAAGGNSSMTACGNKMSTGFNVTRLIPGRQHMHLYVDFSVHIGWRQTISHTAQFRLNPMISTTAPHRTSSASIFHRTEGYLWLTLANILFLTVASIL